MMVTFVVATKQALLIARHTSRWLVEEYLKGKSAQSLAVDPHNPTRVYCGTGGNGLWRSEDAGQSWQPAGPGLAYNDITAVAASPTEPGVVVAGTEPSAVFRSENGGESWTDLPGLQSLPSAGSWSFPPRPDTHHVRWIEPDPLIAGRLFVAIEAGALVRTLDGGQTWLDRVPGGPIDTHTAATHPLAPGRVYSAAGDGYFESEDAGESWSRQMGGLQHHYLVGGAVDPADPDTVIVSAASGPFVAYRPQGAEAYLYRKAGRRSFELVLAGLPAGRGTIASRLTAHPDEPGVFYAANNHGLFRSPDAGQSWQMVDIPWPPQAFAHGIGAFVSLPD